jgi:hypothetical protein
LRLSDAAIRAVAAARAIGAAESRAVTPRDLAAGILREGNTLAAHFLRRHSF